MRKSLIAVLRDVNVIAICLSAGVQTGDLISSETIAFDPDAVVDRSLRLDFRAPGGEPARSDSQKDWSPGTQSRRELE